MDTIRHWGMLLWSDKRNWRDVLLEIESQPLDATVQCLNPHPADRPTRRPPHHVTSWMNKLAAWRLQCSFLWVTCIIKPEVAYCSPASIRAVNDFPCNTEDVFPRESDAKWKVWCNKGVPAPACPVLKTPVLQSDVLCLDDSAEPHPPGPSPPRRERKRQRERGRISEHVHTIF